MLVKGGIRRMADSRWPGIRAMMDVARVKSSEISSDDLSFRLAPRLNAPGRLGESDTGLRILTVTEDQEAKELALKVNLENGRRQRL